MLDTIIGVLGIILSLFPLIASSIGVNHLRTAISTHSTALSLVREDKLRNAYRSYITDLSYELIARTAVTAGSRLSVVIYITLLFLALFTQSRNYVLGAISVGASENEAWALLFSNPISALTGILLPVAILFGSMSCYSLAKVASRRALYINATIPGTQAFKRLIRMVKIYSLILIIPALALPIAYVAGLGVVREEVNDFALATSEAFWLPWAILLVILGLGCYVWATTYFPVSSCFLNARRLNAIQFASVEYKYGETEFGGADNHKSTASFLEALGQPIVNLLTDTRSDGNRPPATPDL